MRTIKILAGLVTGIIALFLAGLLAVWLLVNPNDYKGRVAAAVKESTGRELILQGDIKLTVFPWIALKLGPASLGSPPGFGDEPFLAFNRATVRIALLPLLRHRMDIKRVEIDGLDVRLRKNASGAANWQSEGHTATAAPPTSTPSKAAGPITQLEGIEVTHGRLSYLGTVVANFHLEAGALGGLATPVSVAFDANRGVVGESLTVSATFDVGTDANNKQLRLEAVNLSGLLQRPGDARSGHWEISVPLLQADLAEQTLEVPAFVMNYTNAHLTGKLQATKILGDLGLTGSVALAPLVLREFMPHLDFVLPKTRDPRAFAQLSASTDFTYDASGVRLEQLQAQLDDTHLNGRIALGGSPQVLQFDLHVDQINLDRYLGGDNGAADNPSAAVASSDKSDTTKPVDANGTFNVGAAHWSGLDFTSIHMTVAEKDGVLHLAPVQALVDGGQYTGDMTFDRRETVPSVSVDEHLNGVDIARLMAGTADKGHLSGHGTVAFKATAYGANANSMLQSLNGHFESYLTGGAIEGIDVGYEVATAQALINRESAPQRVNSRRTAFDAFKVSGQISNGVATTNDLMISSQVLRITGQGSANLFNKALDLRLMASFLRSPTATSVDIPLKIGGNYLNPSIRPDIEGLAKGQLKQKLKDVLQKNGLKGLFGR